MNTVQLQQSNVMNEDQIIEALIHPNRTEPPDFHGASKPPVEIQKEKPIHRIMAYMYASGMPLKEIAERTNYSYQGVLLIARQPWFRRFVSKEIQRQGEDVYGEVLRAAATDSLMTVIELSTSAKSETVKLNAAKDILDRAFGKAPQQVKVVKDEQEELEEIERELEALEAQAHMYEEKR